MAALRRTPPPGAWTLWGVPETLAEHTFEGARVRRFAHDPHELVGQRAILAVPSGDVVLYMHQIRPLRPGRSVTVIHDTIPIRYGGSRPLRLAKHAFLLAAAYVSTHVLTDSELSKRAIVRDLRVPEQRITVLRFPVDEERARRVATLRRDLGQEEVLLYVGRFDTHKNLRRLARGFARSGFAARGGTLRLVGGGEVEVREFVAWLQHAAIAGVDVRPPCSESELDRLLATSRALIAPALEEGYGLPAFEAAATGLPVAASRTGAMTELGDATAFFDPLAVDAIAAAIDDVTARPAEPPAPPRADDGLREPVLDALAAALRDGSRS